MSKWQKELDNLQDLKEEIDRMVYRDQIDLKNVIDERRKLLSVYYTSLFDDHENKIKRIMETNDKEHRAITDLMAKIGSQKLVRNRTSSAKIFDSNSPEQKQLLELESFQRQSFDETKVSQSRADLTGIPNCLCPKNDIAKYIDSKWKVDRSLNATTLQQSSPNESLKSSFNNFFYGSSNETC